MDIRIYYQKIRNIEETITEQAVVVRSLETPDGGREGVISEVPRNVAAKMIVEGFAVLASAEETEDFRAAKMKAYLDARQAEAASKVQFTVISADEARALRSRNKN